MAEHPPVAAAGGGNGGERGAKECQREQERGEGADHVMASHRQVEIQERYVISELAIA